MVAAPVTPVKDAQCTLVNRTHQHTHAGAQDVSKSSGWSSCSIY